MPPLSFHASPLSFHVPLLPMFVDLLAPVLFHPRRQDGHDRHACRPPRVGAPPSSDQAGLDRHARLLLPALVLLHPCCALHPDGSPSPSGPSQRPYDARIQSYIVVPCIGEHISECFILPGTLRYKTVYTISHFSPSVILHPQSFYSLTNSTLLVILHP
jgi:hypothetical protein